MIWGPGLSIGESVPSASIGLSLLPNSGFKYPATSFSTCHYFPVLVVCAFTMGAKISVHFLKKGLLYSNNKEKVD